MQILNEEKYVEYILDVTARLLAIDSPSGYTEDAARLWPMNSSPWGISLR